MNNKPTYPELEQRVKELEVELLKMKSEQKQLKEEEGVLRALVNAPTESALLVDMKGKILALNKVGAERLGKDTNELIGSGIFDYLPPEIAEFRMAQGKKVVLSGKPHRFQDERAGRIFDNSIYPICGPEGKVKALAIYARDVTEAKQVEQTLRESEERYRALADSLPQVVFEIDTNGIIIYTNQNGFDFFRYTRDDFDKGMSAFQMLIPEDRERAAENMKRRQSGEALGIREYTALRKDGTTFPIAIQANPIILENGIAGFRGIMIDITDRKQTEKEQERLQSQLQRAQRMESIGTLAGGVAHDFNNLLMGILGRTSLILNKIDSTHPFYEHLKGIERYVEKATDLSKRLLGFARGGKYEVTPTDLNDLIDKSAEMFGRTKKEIHIHIKYQEEVWTVEVDISQIEQVLLNLYINAWQSMPGGGDLYLQTENIRLDTNYIRPFKVDPGRYVKISITDTGVGMDKDIQDRIFEPFFTTKKVARGAGLGLASAYGIIKKHGGIINVYSEKGEGTTFNIYLPASDKEVLKLEEKTHEILKGSETILLVDDEEIIIEVGKKLLEELGYRVLIAQNGKEAIEVYRSHGDEIDMVLLDMIMPDMSGSETFDKLKEMAPGIKVVLSSGYSINGDAKKLLDRGCKGFIQKPFNLAAVSQKTREILDMK
jgi:PAS domain S-box-containing protein